METTKLGIKTGLFAAITLACALFGGYVIAGIIVGYILFYEESKWLRRMGVKTLLVMVCFSVLSTALNLLPDVLDFLLFDFLDIFNVFALAKVEGIILNLISWLSDGLYLLKLVVYGLLIAFSFKGRTVRLPIVDKLLDKFTD